MRNATIIAVFAFFFAPVSAENLEGDFLYRVTTVRAASGSLSDFLNGYAALKTSGYYGEAGIPAPLLMRHSQGDQWDLIFIQPMAGWSSFYDEAATAKRQSAEIEFADLLAKSNALLAFSEDHFAWGPDFESLKKAYQENNFYHIEMFAAAPGKADELLQQRRMENDYLAATGQTTNLIFRRAAGSDIDVFTIGFHENLQAFAAPANASDQDKEAAAVAAGFKDRADISFYLRSLISSHHDTLAVKVD